MPLPVRAAWQSPPTANYAAAIRTEGSSRSALRNQFLAITKASGRTQR